MIDNCFTREIITRFICPQTADRNIDWQACREGDEEDGPWGYGATEEKAKQDLLDAEYARTIR